MSSSQLVESMLPAIEAELRQVVDQVNLPGLEEYHHMLAYHLGWQGEGAGPAARGKRIRPLLLLLSNAAAGGRWHAALPAAAAVELVHNFSLIHDDIQDNSPLRRGRRTLWTLWGIPQAINAGDTMFTLAHLALMRLEEDTPPSVALQAARILQEACLHLTQGQFLDLSYEARGDLTLEEYWPMVAGKTAALLAACTELGALLAGAGEERRAHYRQFGHALGLAFQAQDDLLGIWGDGSRTGKSAQSDLLAGKKSLPVLFGLSREAEFAARWSRGPLGEAAVPEMAALLEVEGARAYTSQVADQLTDQALAALDQAAPQGDSGHALRDLARRLLNRQA